MKSTMPTSIPRVVMTADKTDGGGGGGRVTYRDVMWRRCMEGK